MSLFTLRQEGVKDKYWSYWERDDLLFTTPLKLVIKGFSECLMLKCSVCFGSHLDLQYLRVDLSVCLHVFIYTLCMQSLQRQERTSDSS